MRVKISPTEGGGVAKPATEEIRILKHGGIYAIAGVDVGLTIKYLIENWRC